MHVYFFLKTRSTMAFKDSLRNVQPGEKNEKKGTPPLGPPSSQRVNAAFTNCHLRGPICSGTTRHRQTGPYWQAALSRHGWLAASASARHRNQHARRVCPPEPAITLSCHSDLVARRSRCF